MAYFSFSRGAWDKTQILPTFSVSCRDCVEVTQEDDAIYGGYNERLGDYDYIGLAMAEPVQGDRVISATCSFVGWGAPLLVLADGVTVDEAGNRRFGPMYEIVAYRGGCNVWRILPDFDPDDPKRGYTVRSVAKESFDLPEHTPIDMRVKVVGKAGARRLDIRVADYTFEVEAPALPEKYVIGLTLCEGENRFYSLRVE